MGCGCVHHCWHVMWAYVDIATCIALSTVVLDGSGDEGAMLKPPNYLAELSSLVKVVSAVSAVSAVCMCLRVCLHVCTHHSPFPSSNLCTAHSPVPRAAVSDGRAAVH